MGVVDWARLAGSLIVEAVVRGLQLGRREPILAREPKVDRPCQSWTIS